jgi:hypothetical protein
MRRGCPETSHPCMFLNTVYFFGLPGAKWALLPAALSFLLLWVLSLCADRGYPPTDRRYVVRRDIQLPNSLDLLGGTIFIHTVYLGLKLSVSPSVPGLLSISWRNIRWHMNIVLL